MKTVYICSPFEYIKALTDEEALKIAEDKFEYKLYYNYYLGELEDDGINYDDIRKIRCEEQGLDWEVEKEKKEYLFQKFLIIEAENLKDARKKRTRSRDIPV